MIQHRLHAVFGATLLCVLYEAPALASDGTCAPTVAEAQPAKSKKKGMGLGNLLSAAKNAGAGDLLGADNVLGSGKTAQVVGAVAGTATELARTTLPLAAKNAPVANPCAPASGAPPANAASAASTWN